MRLISRFQALVGTMDATQRFFHSSLCSIHQVLIRYNHQNGSIWVASFVMIAQLALLRSCEPIPFPPVIVDH